MYVSQTPSVYVPPLLSEAIDSYNSNMREILCLFWAAARFPLSLNTLYKLVDENAALLLLCCDFFILPAISNAYGIMCRLFWLLLFAHVSCVNSEVER
jgi:hypothetical protein